MNINKEGLLHSLEESLSDTQYEIEDYKQFVEVSKSRDYEEYASVSVMAMNICTTYVGTDQKVLQSIYKTTRKAVIDILSYDRKFCQEYFFVGKYVIAFFNTPLTACIDEVLDYAGLLNTTIEAINRMIKKKYDASIGANIGIEFDKVLRVNGRLDEYTTKETFHGSPINKALLYADLNVDDSNGNIVISESVRRNLKEEYQKFFKSYNERYFTAKVCNTEAFNWIEEKYPENDKDQNNCDKQIDEHFQISPDLKDKLIKYFTSVEEMTDELTTGNVAHKKAAIKGFAGRAKEYLIKHT